ncbi:MAG: AAA family ATPase [Caldilineaceae bacterium]
MTSLHICLLGNFKMTYNGDLITAVNSARLQSVLAYLLLHSHAPQSRRHMAFQFWPDSTERQARNNLRKALHQLRRALSHIQSAGLQPHSYWLYVDDQTVQWQPDFPCTVDVTEFETRTRQVADIVSPDPATQQRILAEAVALYSGDLLPSCYDEWISPVRERLHQLFLETLERLTWLAEDQQDYATAIHHAQHLLHHDPLHEATYRRLIRLYMANGNRASALRTYHTCAVLLQRELGVEPALETQQVYAQIQDLEIPPGLHAPPQRAEVGVLRLVGRQREWQTLRSAWRQAIRRQPHFALISGEAGIGKTRLAEELLTWAERQGIATARTRAYAVGQGLAYAPVIEWLQSKLLQTALAKLGESRLVEVARLLPDLLAIRPDLAASIPPTTAELSQWQRQQLFAALTHLFLDNREPKLLLIDDLQWCDGETLAWLRYLFSFVQSGGDLQTRSSRLLIVGTVRPEEVAADHPLTALLLDLRSTNQVTEIALTPLNLSETAEVATQVSDAVWDETTMQHLFDQSEGNPLFIVEMVRAGLTTATEADDNMLDAQQTAMSPLSPNLPASALPTGLPSKVLAVIQSRLLRLSPGARQLAGVAAVIGRSFAFDLLLAVSDEDEGTVVNHLDELWQRGIVRTYGGQTYDFSHDRIRDVAYSEISPIRMPRLHRQVAQALEALYAEERGWISAQLADHYEKAGEVARALDYYQQAATVAYNRFAAADAVALLSHALGLVKHLPKTDLRQEQELALLLRLHVPLLVMKGYLAPELGEICARASRLAQDLGRRRELFEALSGLRSFYQMRGRYQNAFSFATQMCCLADEILSVTPSPTTDDINLVMLAKHGVGNIYFYMGRFVEARNHYDQAFALQQPATGLSIFSAMNLWLLGYPDQARIQMHQALVMAHKLGYPHNIGFVMTNLARLNHFLRRNQLAKLWAQRAIALCSSYEIPFWIKLSNLFLGRVWVETGEIVQGIDLLHSTLGQLAADGHQGFCSYFRSLLAEAYACVEQYADAIKALDQALSYVERNGEGIWHPELVRLRGEYLAAQGAPMHEVEAYYQQAIAIARQQASKSLELRATMSLARLWQQQGKGREAHALLLEIYHWFTEGFRTADLQAARSLLSELS